MENMWIFGKGMIKCLIFQKRRSFKIYPEGVEMEGYDT